MTPRRPAPRAVSALALMLALVAGAGAFSGAVRAAAYPDGIPPDETQRLMAAALAAAGQQSTPPRPARALPPCDSAPRIGPRQGNWATAEITCPSPVWSRSLRTGAAATPAAAPAPPAAAQAQALVLTRSMARGEVIGAADLALAPVTAFGPDTHFTDPALVVGRRLKAAVGLGKPLLLRHLERSWTVTEGMPVTILAEAGGLTVSMGGVAANNAAVGDVVSVVNLSSGKSLKAIVVGTGLVSVPTNIPLSRSVNAENGG